MRTKALFVFLLGAVLSSCGSGGGSETYAPKPKGYNRIALPPHAYQPLEGDYPYTFEYSKAAVVLPDTHALAEKYWIYLYYPKLDANIQLTYKPVLNSSSRLKDYIDDAYKLAGKHQIRATAVQQKTVPIQPGKTATLSRLEGDVPTPFQFYTTDSTTHYLRGAIYHERLAGSPHRVPRARRPAIAGYFAVEVGGTLPFAQPETRFYWLSNLK